MRNTPGWIAALIFAMVQLIAAPSQPMFIFQNAPFPSAHASSIVELRNGDLMACWFGGTAEGKPDVAIWTSRLHDGNWSAPAELAREPNIATYNPVMFYTKNNRLWFYYKFGPNPASWSGARRWSDDDGKTWSTIEHLPAGITGPIRAKPLVMNDGTVVSGTSVESYHAWAAWIERSTDNGESWKRIGPITVPKRYAVNQVARESNPKPFAWSETYGIIQPSVVLVSGRKLRFYARSTAQIGRIVVSDSDDAGLTWTDARPLDLPNPNSGIDAIHLRDGRFVLVYNKSTTKRTPLNLAISTDGEHFEDFRTLESGEGEFSYPAMIQDREGNLNITYTWNRKQIKYIRVPLREIPAR
jgi:predicted neuraminidase